MWIRHTLHTNTIQQPTRAASAWVENSAKAASLWKSSEVLLTNGYYKIPLYIKLICIAGFQCHGIKKKS